MRIIDAFMQIQHPGFDLGFNKIHTADTVGQFLGTYLRDQSVLADGMQQALNVQKIVGPQKIIGIYEYEEIDTHREESGNMRIVCFLSGASNDYLKVIDFIFDDRTDTGIPEGGNRNFITGFCIPSEAFSPLIMRSGSYKTRHLGLLYTPGNLVDMAGGVLDELTYEIFTTNKQQLGSATKARDDTHDQLFAKTLDIHYGPRLKHHLGPVSNKLKIRKITRLVLVANRVGRFW